MASINEREMMKMKRYSSIRAKLEALQRRKKMGKVKPLSINK